MCSCVELYNSVHRQFATPAVFTAPKKSRCLAQARQVRNYFGCGRLSLVNLWVSPSTANCRSTSKSEMDLIPPNTKDLGLLPLLSFRGR